MLAVVVDLAWARRRCSAGLPAKLITKLRTALTTKLIPRVTARLRSKVTTLQRTRLFTKPTARQLAVGVRGWHPSLQRRCHECTVYSW